MWCLILNILKCKAADSSTKHSIFHIWSWLPMFEKIKMVEIPCQNSDTLLYCSSTDFKHCLHLWKLVSFSSAVYFAACMSVCSLWVRNNSPFIGLVSKHSTFSRSKQVRMSKIQKYCQLFEHHNYIFCQKAFFSQCPAVTEIQVM